MNSSVNINIKCSDCDEKLPPEWVDSTDLNKCPNCNSINQTIEMGITEEIGVEIHDNVKGKVKDINFNSKRNPRYEFFEGDDLRKNDGKWMKKTRILDKYNDKYIEKVIDPETGEVIHENEELLSKHFGHGSDKFNNDKNAKKLHTINESGMDKEELYKIAIQTRNLEIGMFWQRSNYFMVLNTAIAIGFFTQKTGPYGLVLAALGVIVSMLWFFVNLGGKYWQSRWEHRASIYEKEAAPDAELFSSSKEQIQKDVEDSLSRGNHTGFNKWLDKQILKKPSVSYQMMVLSFFFICFWAATIIIYILASKNA